MEKNYKEEMKKLNEYKLNHHFTYSEIAIILETTTKSLRRWLKGKCIPLPIYRNKISKLLGKDN